MFQRVTILVLAITCSGTLLTGIAFARTAPLSKITVPAPPISGDLAAAAIFEAMLAIGRAKATYPAGLSRAASLYAAALDRYNAGDRTTALEDASQAIAAASQTPYVNPQAWTSPSPTIATTAPMPAVVDTRQADAESYLGITWHVLGNCGVTDPTLLQALRGRYAAAVQENLDHRYADVVADAQVIVTSCGPRAAAAAASPSPSPSPTPAR